MTYHRYHVTDEEFIEAWNKAEDQKEVARRTGMPIGNCRARVNILRVGQGLPLNDLPRDKTKKEDHDDKHN